MGLLPCVLLPGLLLLLGEGTTQIHYSPKEDTSEKEQWPTLVVLKSLPFSCNPKKIGSKETSTSVHSLRPSDIKIVASIGNVETFRKSEVSNVEKQNRTGTKVCMGMVTVLSDIIRHFSPSVLKPMCTPGKEMAPRRGAEGLLAQAEELVRSMKENQQLDFQNDWKLINVFFSNSSHCHLCLFPQQQRSVKDSMSKLSETLDYLHREVPNAYVNLIDLSMILESSSWLKDTMPSQEVQTCKCQERPTTMYEAVLQWSYKETWESSLFSSKYNQGESFTLAYQPFFSMKNVSSLLKDSPLWDSNALALHLWNSMMEPAGHKEKPFSAVEGLLISCPPQGNPYFYTFRNSNYLPSLQIPPEVLEPHMQRLQIMCPDMKPSSPVPTSVHRLKPADIKVIAALGDSITAATGAMASTMGEINSDNRGISWSIGGDSILSTTVTLPNIFREFNSNLTGYSTATGDKDSPGARLNRAVSDAKSGDMTNQAKELIRMMQSDPTINFEQDWKLLTLFIGSNDLCHFCEDTQLYSPENFLNNIKATLDLLKEKVPRVLVNLVSPIDIVPLKEMFSNPNLTCQDDALRQVCPCLHSAAAGSQELASITEATVNYQKRIRELMASGQYESTDFTVALDPFLESFSLPRTKLEPIHKRPTRYDLQESVDLKCPDEDNQFLRTYGNSIEISGTLLQCRNFPSPTNPSSVHALTPADIDVVAALGDSLTAGSGIVTRPGNLSGMETQFRGLSFSGGGDGSLVNVTTLPNIIREFNKNLLGFAVNTGEASSGDAFLNQAVPRAQAKDFLNQVKTLVQKMTDDSRINLADHWKVITVLIGNSDFCDFCTDKQEYTTEKFLGHLRSGLDYLQAQVPKALVNLVDFMSPDIMRQVFIGNPDCPTENASTLCNCVLTPKRNSLGLAALETLSRSYQVIQRRGHQLSGLRELVHSGRYDTRDDFTVVLQPFFQNLILPVGQDGRPDICYFAADCLLPSQRLHTQLARALWNNMMAPLGNKKDFLNLEIEMPLFCPDPNMPYVRTIKNSNYTYPGNPVDKNWGSEFNCKDLKPSKSVPTSVHKLRPADINVVATMGDWITTAWGASPTNISASFTSWRGLSWSIGGDRGLRNQTTLPNILKQFNARLYGSSTGTWKDMAGLNVAKENARAPNLVYQAEELVKLMENISEINSHDNWKLITIFIGINDLCDYCNTLDENAATAYFEGIKTALDVLSLKLSRVFINLVQLMKMTDLYLNYSKLCKPPTLPVFSCPCLSIFSDSFKLGKLMIMNKNFQSAIRKLSSLKEYQNRENFTVVMQPFLQNITIPQNKEGMKSDSFFTEDCFHFSARTHDQMAIALWNNMLESVDSKSTNSDFGSNKNKLICPTPEHPFFFTARKRKTTVTVKIKDAKKRSWRFWLLITLLFLLFIIIVCFLVERYFEKKETNMYMKAKKRKMKHGKAKPLENTEPKEETP